MTIDDHPYLFKNQFSILSKWKNDVRFGLSLKSSICTCAEKNSFGRFSFNQYGLVVKGNFTLNIFNHCSFLNKGRLLLGKFSLEGLQQCLLLVFNIFFFQIFQGCNFTFMSIFILVISLLIMRTTQPMQVDLIDQASKICKIQPFLTTCLNS